MLLVALVFIVFCLVIINIVVFIVVTIYTPPRSMYLEACRISFTIHQGLCPSKHVEYHFEAFKKSFSNEQWLKLFKITEKSCLERFVTLRWKHECIAIVCLLIGRVHLQKIRIWSPDMHVFLFGLLKTLFLGCDRFAD